MAEMTVAGIIGRFVALVILLLLSALFSATETAFTSLSFLQISKLSQKGRRGAILAKLHDKSDNLLTTILLGNNLVNIGATSVATELTLRLFPSLPVVVTTILLTYIVLVFSELTPKRVALANNEWIALNTTYFIWICYYLLIPFIYIVRYSSWLISWPFSRKKVDDVSEEGIIQMVNLGTKSGILENYENRLVHNVFLLNDLTVGSIMTRRQDVFSLDEEMTVEEATPIINQNHYSRIPIYSEEPENITGIVLAKEITSAYLSGNQKDTLKKLTTYKGAHSHKQPTFISEAKKVNVLFDFFKSHHLKMAIVLDEYSGLAGIITQEDVIEAIMGQLYDENEVENDDTILKIDKEEKWQVFGNTPIFQLNDTLDAEIPSSRDFKTIAGFIMQHWDVIPKEGQSYEYKKYRYHITEMDNHKIEKIIVTPTNNKPEKT